MPPKKNGTKNAEKPSKNVNSGFGEKSDDVLSEAGKEFYRAQIRDLEERLQKYQRKCDELEIREKDFSANFNNVEREKKEIVCFLKRSLDQKAEDLADLSEKLQALQIAKDEEKEVYEMQLSMLRHEFQETKDKFTSENMVLAGKLASLEDFRMQKDELMAILASLKEQLEQQKQEHQTAIYNLEKKAVLDIDRQKKDMQQHVAAVAAEFRKISDKKMPKTTMQAIQENVAVTGQLRRLSEMSKELLKENNSLKAREKQLKIDVEIMEPLLNEMTRKSLGNQKVVQQLTEKCKQMHTELENYARLKEENQKLLDNHSTLLKVHKALRQKHESDLDHLRQTQTETERLKKECQEEKAHKEQLEMVLHEAAMAVKAALVEVSKEEDTEAQRSLMMQKLLAMLDTAAAIGKGPAPCDFITITGTSQELLTEPGMDGLDLALKTVSHFKTGDLGLIPHQTHKHKSTLSNKSSRLNLQRKQQSQTRT